MTAIYKWGDDLGVSMVERIFGSSFTSDIITKMISILSVLVLWILVLFIFKYIVLIIVAPIMSVLSEKIEYYETGKAVAQNLNILNQLYLMARGIRLAISNLGRELSITIVLITLSFIPGFAIFTTPLIFIIQAYYAGFGNLDFFMERYFTTKESRNFISLHKGLAVANGSIFLFLLFIPIVGAFIAPSLATIAGTISGLEALEE